MSEPSQIATLNHEDFKWLWEAHAYNHVTPISAAATRLSIFRKHIASGGTVNVKTMEQDCKFVSAVRFDEWVFAHFPDCIGIYPKTNVGTVAQLRSNIAKQKEEREASDNLLQTLRDANFRK